MNIKFKFNLLYKKKSALYTTILIQLVILTYMFLVNRLKILFPSEQLYIIFSMIIPLLLFISGSCYVIKEYNEKIKCFKIVAFLIIIVNIVVLAWNTDDAYHGFVMSRNWIEGNGLVYNVGERVNASTMPLNTIIQGIMYWICGDMPYGAMYLGIVETGIALCLILNVFCAHKLQIVLVLLCWTSKSLITFATSGLENSLLFLFAALYLYIIVKKESYDKTGLIYVALLMGCIAFTRMDAVLLFLPISIYIFLCRRNSNISFFHALLIGFVGITPFLLWECFSLLYYGFLFPNTAYAKLGTGYPMWEYWKRGFSYILATASSDLIIMCIQVFYILLALKKKEKTHLCIACGVILYNLYLINVGGDFMVGRHFTVTGLASLCGIVMLYKNDHSVFIHITWGLCAAAFFTASTSGLFVKYILWPAEKGILETNGVADERDFYFDATCLLSRIGILHYRDYEQWSNQEIKEVEGTNIYGKVISWAPGILRYYYAQDKIIEDSHALGDAFLTRLPADDTGDSWRVGHMYRSVPAGYNETLATGENKLIDPHLREFYEHLSLIIKGDILSWERFKTIINMNLGKYDYLIKNYEKEIQGEYYHD